MEELTDNEKRILLELINNTSISYDSLVVGLGISRRTVSRVFVSLVEKTFDNLKNFIDSSRIRTHTSETRNGKLFAAFISLIIKTKIDEVIDTKLKKESISAKKLINQMKTIKLTKLYDGK